MKLGKSKTNPVWLFWFVEWFMVGYDHHGVDCRQLRQHADFKVKLLFNLIRKFHLLAKIFTKKVDSVSTAHWVSPNQKAQHQKSHSMIG